MNKIEREKLNLLTSRDTIHSTGWSSTAGTQTAVFCTTFVPPPEVPRGCGMKGRGQGRTGPKRAKVAQVASVRSRGNWREVYSGGQGA